MSRPAWRLLASCALPLATWSGAAVAAPAGDLAGTWAGTMIHESDTTAFALTFEPAGGDTLELRLRMPVIHLDAPLGRIVPKRRADSLVCGPFVFARDAKRPVLRGRFPAAFAPVYAIPFQLEKVARFDMPDRPPLDAPIRLPHWEFDAGSAVWAGVTFADSSVYAGTEAGAVHALDARTGRLRWTFTAGGAVRVRPTVVGDAVYFQADDGHLYCLNARTGDPVWIEQLIEAPIVRLPFSDPESRYDRFGSEVIVWEGHLFVGTHDGRMVALNPRTGHVLWTFLSGDAVLAAPAVERGVLVFGSYDGKVYGLEALTGRLIWSHDAKAPVVSTPAVYRGAAVVGTRGYDLLALNMRDGALMWKRYIWMSWIESSASLVDDVAYVGSSDAAAVFAYHVTSGQRMWKTDVHGWTWGQPAATSGWVYVGASSQVGYPADHSGGFMALDLASGKIGWRYPSVAPESGAYGFPGSAATGLGRVFAGDLSGRIHAFEQ
jgi:outer membrane protein assembly factor BamB